MTKWFIAIKKRGKNIFDVSGMKRWKTSDERYEADPFIIKDKGKNYLFYEDYDRKKGVISYSVINGLRISSPKVVLDLPCHVSYPHIFKEGESFYMIPESSADRSIHLFKAIRFPDKWEFIKTIWDDGHYADSNIFEYKHKWWLFTIGGHDNNLVILKSDLLMGKWEKHFSGMMPHSRGAGNIFEHRGKIIRPVQDDSGNMYGGAIIFKEITLPEYSEKIIKRIDHDWYPGLIGTHTFNFSEDYVVIDGKLKID